MLEMYRYHNGRPAKVRRYQLQMLQALPIELFFFGLDLLLLWCASQNILWLQTGFHLKPALLLPLDFLFILLVTQVSVVQPVRDWRYPGRVVPYFKRCVPHPDRKAAAFNPNTFGIGLAVAARWQQLDVLALQRGLLPLSKFGFADDLLGELLTWHDAAKAIDTLKGLIAGMGEAAATWPCDEKDAVLAELCAWHNALLVAEERGVPFCFVVRMRDAGIVPLEMI